MVVQEFTVDLNKPLVFQKLPQAAALANSSTSSWSPHEAPRYLLRTTPARRKHNEASISSILFVPFVIHVDSYVACCHCYCVCGIQTLYLGRHIIQSSTLDLGRHIIQSSTQMDAGRANWDDNTTKIFLDLCIDEKNKLNYNKRGLTKDWRKLKDKSGTGWNNSTRTIDCDDEWWAARIEENEANKHFRGKAFPFYDELTTLFGTTDTEGGPMLCVGGIGDRTPSCGSEDTPDPMADENVDWLEDTVGRSSVGRVSQRSGKEHVVDSLPPKRTKSMEYYVERISESMIQRTMNERNLISREEEEVTEMLHLVEQDGIPNGSELYFIATELFRSPARRASYRSITASENRIAWLRWTWDNVKRK